MEESWSLQCALALVWTLNNEHWGLRFVTLWRFGTLNRFNFVGTNYMNDGWWICNLLESLESNCIVNIVVITTCHKLWSMFMNIIYFSSFVYGVNMWPCNVNLWSSKMAFHLLIQLWLAFVWTLVTYKLYSSMTFQFRTSTSCRWLQLVNFFSLACVFTLVFVQFLFIFFVVLVTLFLNNPQNSQSSAYIAFATLAMVPFLLFMMWFPKIGVKFKHPPCMWLPPSKLNNIPLMCLWFVSMFWILS